MAAVECIHGLALGTCASCRSSKVAEMVRNTSSVVRAAHASRCGVCEDAIEEGDRIVLLDGSWVHAECGE